MSNRFLETSTIHDGNMSLRWGEREEVLSNRRAFLKQFNKEPEDCVVIAVEHEDKVTHVNSTNRGQIINSEAFITKSVDAPLFLLTADCLPVVFCDPIKEIIALAHLGWKPIDKGLAAKVVREMAEAYECAPADVRVFVGPSIRKESYVVENPIQKDLPQWSKFITKAIQGGSHVDLAGYVHDQLLSCGVSQENIKISPIDSAASGEYFSHYRSVRNGEAEGRFATIVGMV